MSDVPVTHFTPKEIDVDWKRLHALGYTHDWEGHPLESDDQMLELFPQDFIVAENACRLFLEQLSLLMNFLSSFTDWIRTTMRAAKTILLGNSSVPLHHTHLAVSFLESSDGRIAQGYAHPLFHAAKRRNCDGDEDAIMLLMDGLLNFSREILPANRGGQMDAPPC